MLSMNEVKPVKGLAGVNDPLAGARDTNSDSEVIRCAGFWN